MWGQIIKKCIQNCFGNCEQCIQHYRLIIPGASISTYLNEQKDSSKFLAFEVLLDTLFNETHLKTINSNVFPNQLCHSNW